MRSACGGANEAAALNRIFIPLSSLSRLHLIPFATLFHVLIVQPFIKLLPGLRTRHSDPCKHGVALAIAPVRILVRVHIADAR